MNAPPRPDRTLRLDALRTVVDAAGAPALIVTNASNIRWLSGFTGSNAMLAIDADHAWLCTDARYGSQAPAQIGAHGVDIEPVIGTDLVASALGVLGPGPLALEADDITWATQQSIAERSGAEPVATSGLVERLRARKDGGEQALIARAAELADAALASVFDMIRPGVTEREIGAALDAAIRHGGGSGPAYETIVASGPNAALPHARPTDRKLEANDLVIVDVGALLDGYRSDMTRTMVLGTPNEEQDAMLRAVLDAQTAGIAEVRPGTPVAAIDAACRSVLGATPWADRFIHGTGHGVGLDIHELPAINGRSADVLEAGMVVTVEPGIYVDGVGGVRWEDLLLVTETGADVLTASPKPFCVEPRRA